MFVYLIFDHSLYNTILKQKLIITIKFSKNSKT